MKIFSASQIRAWDHFTMEKEPIASQDLMERASGAVFRWITERYSTDTPFYILCGPGNNGGDGLAVSRMLFDHGYQVSVFLMQTEGLSKEAEINLHRLNDLLLPVQKLESEIQLPEVPEKAVLVDALFGTGLSRPLEGWASGLVQWINYLPNRVISIDIPSGLPADSLAANESVVCADYTLSFQAPKYAFFLPENEAYTGSWEILPIGLHTAYSDAEKSIFEFVDKALINTILPSERSKHAHKGNFGHAALLGGSAQMMGAIIMAVKACLHSGAGLLSAGVPEPEAGTIFLSAPEAMVLDHARLMHHETYTNKTAIGAGMGWISDDFHTHLLNWLMANITEPLLLDATALYILSKNREWFSLRPEGSITVITPHHGEFYRLVGVCKNSEQRLEKARKFASDYQVFIVLKGAYTQVITPGGLIYFNSTGNPGMAKGGSGDALAGLITGLLAQGMDAVVACLLGVYMHGLAGDLAASEYSRPAMTVTQMISQIPEAWKHILKK